MNGFKRLAARTGAMALQQLRNRAYLQAKTLTGRRSTSWMALEGPSPSLYKKIYEDASRVEKAAIADLAKVETILKKAFETVEATGSIGRLPGHDATAHISTTTAGDKDATMPNTGISASLPADSRYLCTMLIKVPGRPATWPCKEEDSAIECDATSTAVPNIKAMKP